MIIPAGTMLMLPYDDMASRFNAGSPPSLDSDSILFAVLVMDDEGHQALLEIEDYLDGMTLWGPQNRQVGTRAVSVYWLAADR